MSKPTGAKGGLGKAHVLYVVATFPPPENAPDFGSDDDLDIDSLLIHVFRFRVQGDALLGPGVWSVSRDGWARDY